jgi:magnesium-transporting ATPase (P-type)
MRCRVVAKGAPEVMQQFLAEVPADYEESYKHHAAQGSR